MSTRVCLLSFGPEYPEGGYLWVFLNWALGLRSLGCEVTWLVDVSSKIPLRELQVYESAFRARAAPYGLSESLRFCVSKCGATAEKAGIKPSNVDLLLNVGHYEAPPALLRPFRRSAILDIDPGLTQIWMAQASLDVAPHDLYFTIGETVGRSDSPIPDAGIEWHYTPPCVFLDMWRPHPPGEGAAFTTVSHWWGETDTKRDGFLPLLDLPRRTLQPLELALCLGDAPHELTRLLEMGWRVCDAHAVASGPSEYQRYIQNSLGEFTCVKPSCVHLQNAWISDRTLCYLASGKPAIVQHTGPSGFLPDAAGIFRFRDLSQAVHSLDYVAEDYERQCRLARGLAEEYFDARKIVAGVLDRALA